VGNYKSCIDIGSHLDVKTFYCFLPLIFNGVFCGRSILPLLHASVILTALIDCTARIHEIVWNIMAYSLARNLLFKLQPETAHELSLDTMSAAHRLGLLKPFMSKIQPLPVKVMGLDFPNPVGLAAGLDKNAEYIDAMGALGFGFVEVGTVTPKAQPGNPKPRLFRLPEKEAVINRMGFNNNGLDLLIARVKKSNFAGPIGINIGKNFSTPVEQANDDYRECLRAAYDYADYITVNVSSPNTPGLRTLQFGDALTTLLDMVKYEQNILAEQAGRYVPIAVKIAPDMTEDEVRLVANAIRSRKLDAVIASNTTLDRAAVQGLKYADEAGGLSGLPVREKSTKMIRVLADSLEGDLPIIGVGGIMNGDDAVEKIKAGASLVQIYTGFIYHGPALVRDCVEAIRFAK
jgi:dihydroorotate dehydrogenase